MLRIFFALATVLVLASGPVKQDKSQTPDQNPQTLPGFYSCEEGYPPKACPPHCGC